MDFVNKDNYNQFEVVMQNHTSYDLKHNNCKVTKSNTEESNRAKNNKDKIANKVNQKVNKQIDKLISQ